MTRRAAVGCAPALLGALDFGFVATAGPAIAEELALGAAYAWLFSAGSLAYGAVVMPAEALVARVGAGRLVAAALTVAAAGVVALALAGDSVAALAGRVLFGAGTGAAAAPALVLLAQEGDAAFARMGGAIALGFSAGVLLGATGAWRPALAGIAALAVAAAATARGPSPRGDVVAPAGAARIGAATAAAGAFMALVRADLLASGLALAVAAALAASGWRAVRPRLQGPVLVPCAAGAATTMSGVGATALLGLRLDRTPSPVDDLALALFGVATLAAVGVARRLAPEVAAMAGLAAQALAILALVEPSALVPAVALFGAGHVVANAGAAAAVMRHPGMAGLYATGQYLAAGAGALVVLGVGDPAGMTVAAAVALAGIAMLAAQRLAPTQSASRSA